jgi:hypothetical protein
LANTSITILAKSLNRPSADEKRDGCATFHLDAGRHHHNQLHEPLNHYEWEDLKANPSKLLGISLGQHALRFYFLFSGVLEKLGQEGRSQARQARTAAG